MINVLWGLGGSLLRSFLVSGILLVQRHTTQNQFSAFGLRYEHYIRCYWQVCSTGSCPVPLLRTALTLFVPTSWDGCIRQNLDSKVVVRVKRWPTRKKSLLILLSWLVKQRFPLGPVPAALSQLVPVGVVLEGAIWDDPAIEANYVSAEERRGSIRRKKRNSAQVVWMSERWEAVVLRLWRLPPGGDSIVAFSKRPNGRGYRVHPNPVLKCGVWKERTQYTKSFGPAILRAQTG